VPLETEELRRAGSRQRHPPENNPPIRARRVHEGSWEEKKNQKIFKKRVIRTPMVRCRDEFMSHIHYFLHTYRLTAPARVIFFSPEYIHILSTSSRQFASYLNLLDLVSFNCEVSRNPFVLFRQFLLFILIHISKLLSELATRN
jgi:hypothetical protein